MHIYKHKYVPIYLRICMDRGMARCEWADGGWERELGEGVGRGGGERGVGRGGWGEGGGERGGGELGV